MEKSGLIDFKLKNILKDTLIFKPIFCFITKKIIHFDD